MKRFIPGVFVAVCLASLLAACAGTQGGASPASPATSAPVSDYKPVEPVVTGASRTRAKSHTDLGLAYLEAGNVAVALEEAKMALRDDSTYGPAYNLKALAHMYLQERPLAQENFEKALRLAPNDPDINNNFGWFLCQGGDTARAMALFNAAIRNPLYNFPTRPYTNAGMCAMRAGDLATAEVNFLRAVNADPRNSQAVYNLADLFYRRGNFIEARKYLSEFHAQQDPVAESLWLAVRIERKLGDKVAEAGFASQLRRRFAGTPEHQALMQGNYD
ncbi:type IV pilus biogenesis/stability protein PilW [Methyloversatilis thermotolerans]|uniref:type IV pilus biogenesis/stability protein PilW n=1 Tax=Methyloversatilis thermotolerans TaxID=1346290 RepID=UPI00039AFCC6|nr:type IV pilus biogenesis/stability protein PilW [Methyloversatilis thermotolerans]